MSQEKDPKSGIFKNEDGTYTVSVIFKTPKPISKKRLGDMADDLASASDGAECCEDSLPAGLHSLRYIAQVAIAEDEAISLGLPVEDAKPVATSYEDCKAANPMYCPYHGLAAIKDKLSAYMKAKGLPYFNVNKLPSGSYALTAHVQSLDSAKKYNAAFQGFLKENGIVAFASTTLTEATGAELSPYKADTVAHIADFETHEADYEVIPDIEKALEEGNEAVNPDDYMAYLQALSDGDTEKAKQLADKMQSDLDFDGAELADVEMMMNETAKHYIGLHSEKLSKKNNIANLLEAAGHPNHFPGFKELGESDSLGIQIAKGFEAIHKQLNEALAAGDLQGAKQALEKFMDAVEKYEDTVDLFAKNADAMKQNIAKYADMTKVAPPKDPAEAAKWWAKNGIVHPLELSSAATLLALNGENLKGNAANGKESHTGKTTESTSASAPAPVNAKSEDIEIPDEIMKPLEHDESKFPQNLTQAALDAAIAAGKSAGGAGGLNTKRIVIDGKSYYCKSGSGSKAHIIRNGYNCDMAYRAGGVCAPDAKLYEFGGKVYKLSEAVEGTLLIDAWKNADSKQKAAIRAELLKGYPLDVLFSNWDVLGTNMGKSGIVFDNIIVGKDGKCWRIDNDGAFGKTGTGGEKDLSWAKGSIVDKCAFEDWDAKGGWSHREWIDDFRTMRLNPKNKGIFSEYTTADIFLSAGNCNMAAAVKTLPKETQKALAKPLHEMNQMALHAVSANISDYGNREMMTMALDAMYEASKLGMRELSSHSISWGSGGFGDNQDSGTFYQAKPFGKPEPTAPKNPLEKDYTKELKNSEYTGNIIGATLVDIAKTINHHAGYVAHDKDGNILGNGTKMDNPDYTPNPTKVAAFEKIDREKLAELAKTDASALEMLNVYDAIQNSKAQGWKIPIGHVQQKSIAALIPETFKTKAELAIEKDKEAVKAQYDKDYAAFEKEHKLWVDEKSKHDEAEHAKAVASGKSPYKNFNDFAQKLISKNIDTNGIAHPDGSSIDFIEHGKDCNKFGKGYSASTKEDSWTPPSSMLKVLELVFRGMGLEGIKGIKDTDPLLNNGHHSGSKAKKWFMSAAQHYIDDAAQFDQHRRVYAMWKGLQTLKLENESCDVIHKDTHSVTLGRSESYKSGAEGQVVKVTQKAANTSCGFQSNGCLNPYAYTYDVPFWCVSYTYNDANRPDSEWDSHKGTEHEFVASLIGLTPYMTSSSVGYAQAMQQSLATPQFKKIAAKRKNRLALFMN